jgi:GTP-binding protein Era
MCPIEGPSGVQKLNIPQNTDPDSTVFRSGFVALVGPPNAGKSTFLNRVLKEKISITSKKPQTTRNRILGIVHRPGAQILFVDTPGVFQGAAAFNFRLVRGALAALSEADVVLLMLDAAAPDPDAEATLLKALESKKPETVLAFNKVDITDETALTALRKEWAGAYPFEGIFFISAKEGTGVEALVGTLGGILPEGPPYFDETAVTDRSLRFLAAERIREKVFRLTGQEIPYATAVTVETFSRSKNRSQVRIRATIHVERDSQKGILIGNAGQKLKQIGIHARQEIESFMGCRVFLELFVRVQKKWRKDPKALRKFGYE